MKIPENTEQISIGNGKVSFFDKDGKTIQSEDLSNLNCSSFSNKNNVLNFDAISCACEGHMLTLSVFDDELHSCIKKIDFDDFPLGFSDSLKTGEYPFNYGTYFSERENNENLFIESINTAKLKDNTIISKQSVPKFYVGFVDITLSNPRNII